MTPERFDDLVQEVRPALWRYLARRTDPEAAADALADTLLVLWRRRADIPAVDPLPWCYRVAAARWATPPAAHGDNAARLRLRRATAQLRTDLQGSRPISGPTGHRSGEGAEASP